MPIDNQPLLAFTNDTVRPLGDRLAGLLPLLTTVPDAVVGQGLAAVLGTTDAELFRASPWTADDYAAVTPQAITGSDSGGRVQLTTHDVIGLLRVVAALGAMAAANPSLGPLVGKIAVNPRA